MIWGVISDCFSSQGSQVFGKQNIRPSRVEEREEGEINKISLSPGNHGGANCPESAEVYKIFSYAESTNKNLIETPASVLFLKMEMNYSDVVFLSKLFHCSSH